MSELERLEEPKAFSSDKFDYILSPPPLVRDGKPVPRGISARVEALVADALALKFYPRKQRRDLYNTFTVPKEHAHLSVVEQAAMRFQYVYGNLTPFIREGELIVGSFLREPDPDGVYMDWFPNHGLRFHECFLNTLPCRLDPDIRAAAEKWLLSPADTVGHQAVDYGGYLRSGSRGCIAFVRAIERDSADVTQQQIARAYITGHESLLQMISHYAGLAADMVKTAFGGRREELLTISAICEKISRTAPETFREALQALWFAYMVAGDGLGRIDQYLYDFYLGDLAAGRITPDGAQELLECLLVKLYSEYPEGVVNVSSIHTITVGGMGPDGKDQSNEVTRLLLHAARNVRLLRPTIYIRTCADTPDDLFELGADMLGEGIAEPHFYGDKPIVDGLVRVGVAREDAVNYALSGCSEVVLQGLGNTGSPNGFFNAAAMADEVIRGCVQSGGVSQEALWRAWEAMCERMADLCRESMRLFDEHETRPFLENMLFYPCCVENGRLYGSGGAKYYLSQWEVVGLANAADMMFAAMTLSREGALTPDTIRLLDREDPALMRRLRSLPKFCNDIKEVDEVAARALTVLARSMEKRRTALRKALTLGSLAGANNIHLAYGMVMGPTLDGRGARKSLADSLAGSQGVTVKGLTAIVASLLALDHSLLPGGTVCTLRIGKEEFATPDRRKKVAALIKTYCNHGGGQLQLNVADAEELRQAQENPEEHAGLCVRVAGYSAVFIHLGGELQNEIIERISV